MKQGFLIALFLLIILGTSKAQVPQLLEDEVFRKRVSQALDSVYNLKFEASKQLLAADKKKYPSHPLWEFWDGLLLWWTILPDLENTQYDAEFFYRFRKSDYEANRLLDKQDDHIDALILKIIANGFIARQLANRDEWVSSLNAARVGVESLLELKDVKPEMVDILFGEGLYDFYLDYLPKEYPVLQKLSWVLPEGNKELGLQKLQTVADSGLFLRVESRYFLGNIYQNYEFNTDLALTYFTSLSTDYPDNPFYAKRLVPLYFNSYTTSKAIELCDSLIQKPAFQNSKHATSFFGLANYFIGKAYWDSYEVDSAAVYLHRAVHYSIKLSNGTKRSLYGTICYYLGRVYERKMNYPEAIKWYKQAEKTSSEFAELSGEIVKRLKK